MKPLQQSIWQPSQSVRIILALAALAAMFCTRVPVHAQAIEGCCTSCDCDHELEYALEIIDAKGFTANGTPGISGDPTAVPAPGYDNRTGVFADGTSVLVIRLDDLSYNAGPVTFTVTHGAGAAYPQTADYVGSVSTAFPAVLPAPDSGAGLGATSAVVPATSPKLVFYRPPNNFFFGQALGTKTLTVTATSGAETLAIAKFDLVRPTIILTHGFASEPGVMDAMKGYLTTGRAIRVRELDWHDINTTGYNASPVRIHNIIADETSYQQDHGVAATRMDFFAHSMGGTIIKWYASDIPSIASGAMPRNWPSPDGFPDLVWNHTSAPFRQDSNFGAGDIRRFVSFGSPFQGSPIADFVKGDLSYSAICTLFPILGLSPDGTAIDDLSVTGRAGIFLDTRTAVISWMPIVGIATPQVETDYIGSGLGLLLATLGGSPSSLGLLNTNSDFVVPNISAVDRGAGPFPPMARLCKVATNTNHGQEPSANSGAFLTYIVHAFDLSYTAPTDPGYYQGYTLFNPGF